MSRRSVSLLAAVFASGAGIGAAAVALTHHPGARRVVLGPTRPRGAHATVVRASPPPPPSGTSNSPTLVPAGASASFSALASHLPGRVGLAVAPLGAGQIQTFGPAQIAHAWSTSKVPVLVTLMRDDEAANRTLTPDQATNATLALEQSDNAAIEALFGDLEQRDGGLIAASADVQRTLRAAGDEATVINTAPNDEGFTTYGQSEWALTGEVTFYRALARGCVLNPSDTAYVLSLMRSVIASQRWGAGAAGYPASVPVAFKGGWGPDSTGSYQVRQTAIVGGGARGYVLSMLALPDSGTFTDGTAMVSALASWARAHFELHAGASPAACTGGQ